MWRTIWTLGLGIVFGALSVVIFRLVGDYVFPPPVPLDMLHPDQAQDLHPTLPLGAHLNAVLSWCMGAFVAAAISGIFTRQGLAHALTCGFVVATGGAVLLFMAPNPTWVPLLTLSLGMIFSWTAAKLFADPHAQRFGAWL